MISGVGRGDPFGVSEFEKQIQRIRTKLNAVRQRGADEDDFGASAHDYQLGPPLDEDSVRAFEVEHGVTLPDAFRAFLTRVGHGGPGPYGGAGPYYGLYGLEGWEDFVSWIADETPADWLRRPSPLRPGSNELPETDIDEVPDEDWPPEELLGMYAGVMTVGTRGCTYVTGLIITGESRGRVVYLDADHYEPPYVVRDADFLDWYERWLDELLAGYQSSWFGYGPAGGEEQLLQIIQEHEDSELVAEAIGNLHKLPQLSDDVWDVVAARIADDSSSVRVRVIRLLAKSPRVGDINVIASRWDDADTAVVGEVLRALVDLAPEQWADRVWSRMWSDEVVREFAFAALLTGNQFTTEQLIEMLQSDAMAQFRGRVTSQVRWTQEHAELLFNLLGDDDTSARRESANALTRLEIAPADHRLLDALERETDHFVQAAMIRLIAAAEERRAGPQLLKIAAEGQDFQRLAAVDALCKLGDESVLEIAEQMLGMDRKPVAPGMSHTRTIPDLVRDSLNASPSPKLRALGKVV